MRFLLFISLIFSVSCGQDTKQTGGAPVVEGGGESSQTTDDNSTMLIQAGAEIPPCDKDNKLIYVQDEATFKVCMGGNWSNIDLRGPKGDAGVNGTNGVDNKIIKSIGCGGGLEGASDWTFYYSAALMASGDLFVTGQIGNAFIETSATSFYSSQQMGATSGAVILRFDALGADNAGYWKISLDRSTLVTTVDYKDFDASGGSDSWTMTPDKCTVNDYTTP